MKKTILVCCVAVGMVTYSFQSHAQSSTKSKPKIPSAQPVSKPMVQTKPAAAAHPAEDPLQFGISIEPVVPLGDLKEVATFGGGINGLLKYKVTDKLSVRASVGYMRFMMKTVHYTEDDGTGNIIDYSIKPKAIAGIPVRLGGSYDITDNLFVQAAIGASFVNNGVGTAFLYTPGLGYRFGNIEAMAKYEVWSKNGNLSFAALHIGYYF